MRWSKEPLVKVIGSIEVRIYERNDNRKYGKYKEVCFREVPHSDSNKQEYHAGHIGWVKLEEIMQKKDKAPEKVLEMLKQNGYNLPHPEEFEKNFEELLKNTDL